MRIKILLLTSLISILSCHSEQKLDKSATDSKIGIENEIDIEAKTKNDTLEKVFPSEKETIKNDTLIKDQNITIQITRSTLNSYIVDEFTSEGVTNIHKYLDFENHLTIIKNSEVLIDTIFRKQNFIKNTGPEFQNIAVFHGYWFNEIKGKKIELFGMISKPETDEAYAFQHFFDITTGEFEIKNSIDEEY